jgi:hypothetical protein
MIDPAPRRRRSRRFFGLRGVVPTRPPTAGDDRRPSRPRRPCTEADAFQSERTRFAQKLDLELRLACRSEATLRRELGSAARTFLRARAYRRLGFVRLGDYARERLGVSERTLQTASWLETRLDGLPAVAGAYDRCELSWAQARAICKIAAATDEAQWLAVAKRSTVETLERLVARAGRPVDVPNDPEGEQDEIDGEPAVRWRFACPARVRALWRRACELASRGAGEPLAQWRAAEVIAAEGSSGRPVGASLGDRALVTAVRLARRARRNAETSAAPEAAFADRAGAGDADRIPAEPSLAADPRFAGDTGAADLSNRVAAVRHGATPSLEPPESSDPRALDARLIEAVRLLRTIEPRIGRLLRVVVDQRIHRWFGYPALDDYVRERLGISARKAWALLKVEKATARSGAFADAYREGRLSWVRSVSLLPVLDRENARAWITRAEIVTVRRLCDEVDWVLCARDALGTAVPLAPPPLDDSLTSPVVVAPATECRDSSLDARLHIRAHADALDRRAAEVSDAEIRFTGPASVVALLRDVLDAFGDPYEPRWIALERLLRHVITHWESTPRHPDPVFARDGWRCTVPACSSRRNLHDHHVRFRSRGGDDRPENRTVVCAAHHLHGIHDGTIHASGTAPHAIEWQLGVRPGAPPFLAFVGDRYCSTG